MLCVRSASVDPSQQGRCTRIPETATPHFFPQTTHGAASAWFSIQPTTPSRSVQDLGVNVGSSIWLASSSDGVDDATSACCEPSTGCGSASNSGSESTTWVAPTLPFGPDGGIVGS